MLSLVFMVLLLSLFKIEARGQNNRKPSGQITADTLKVTALLKKALPAAQNPATVAAARQYLKEIWQLSAPIRYSKGMVEYHRLMAVTYYVENKLEPLSAHIQKATLLATTMKNNRELALVKDLQAWIFQAKEEKDSAIYYYLQALSIAKALPDAKFSGEIETNISEIFWLAGDFPKAEKYARSGYRAGIQARDTQLIAQNLLNIGNATARVGKLDTALLLFKQVERMVRDPNIFAQVRLRAITNTAAIYGQQGNYTAAIQLLQHTLKDNQTALSAYMLAYLNGTLADAYFHNKDIDSATKTSLFAIQKALTVPVPEVLKDSYLLMAKIRKSQKQYQAALSYMERYDSINNLLSNAAKEQYIHSLETKYRTAQKDNQITTQMLAIVKNKRTIDQKNHTNLLLGAGLLLFALIGGLVYRNFQHRHHLLHQQDLLKEQRIAELEKERQLVTMQALLKGQEQERSRLAKDLHDGVGGLLSGVKLSLSSIKGNMLISESSAQSIENVLRQLDLSIAELRRVSHNMMPEALIRFGLKEALENYCENIHLSGKLKVHFQCYAVDNLKEKRLPQHIEIVIYRIVQELLNNVIKHAHASQALIQLMLENDRFSLTVEDDGIGFDPNSSRAKEGAGLHNINARADFLGATVDIHSVSSDDGKDPHLKTGTSVHIEGPSI